MKESNNKEYFNQDRPDITGTYYGDPILERYLQNKLGNGFDIDFLTKSKREIVAVLLKKLEREQLKGIEGEKDIEKEFYTNSFLATGTDTEEKYMDKVKNRTLTKEDYDKILKQIEENGSILPTTNKRNFSYGGAEGDVILSSTTGNMYCVEDDADRENLIRDYNGHQYYQSRSGMSGAGNIKAGKNTLLYLPTVRKDIKNPEANGFNLNGLNIFAWADRGVVDKNYPVTIVSRNNKDHNLDYIFIDPTNVNEIIDIVKSGGEYPESFKKHTQVLGEYYIDESGDKSKTKVSYLSDKQIDKKRLYNILQWTNGLPKFKPELENTTSEFDRVIGLHKTKNNNTIVLNRDGVGIDRYGKYNPREMLFTNPKGQELFEYVVGDGNRISREYYGDSAFDNSDGLNIRGWDFIDKNTVSRNTTKYIFDYDLAGNYVELEQKRKVVLHETDLSEFGFKKDEIDQLNGLGNNGDPENDEVENVWNNIGGAESNNQIFDIDDKKIDTNFVVNNGKLTIMLDMPKDQLSDKRPEFDISNILKKILKEKEIRDYVYSTVESQLNSSFGNMKRKVDRSDIGELDVKKINIDNWGIKNNMVYKTIGDKVYIGYIVKNANLNPKFNSLDNSYQDYEKVISKNQREEHGKDYWNSYMREKAYDKSSKDYVNFYRWSIEEQIKEATTYLLSNQEKRFFIQDSLEVGNCLPGTEGFIKKFGIENGITGKELLEHKRFQEMIQNGRFRNIIFDKISIETD